MLQSNVAAKISDNMATKKFSTFEFASLADTGKSSITGLNRYDVFETPYGYAFVLIINEGGTNNQSEISGIAMERIRYFLKNAPDEKSEHVAQNAIIYVSGYLYQYGNKNTAYKAGNISCMCVLLHEERVHYAWYGNVELLLFTGKRFYLLGGQHANEKKSAGNNRPSYETAAYLGQQVAIEPYTADTCLEPVSHDKLLLTSGNISHLLNTKETKRILCDNMPLQTKVVRIIRELRNHQHNNSLAITLIRFYGFQNKERKLPSSQLITKPDVEKKTGVKIPENNQKETKKQHKPFLMIRNILYVLGFIVVGYLFYDLFIKDPHPPISLPDTLSTVAWESTVVVSDTLHDNDIQAKPVVPEDVVYVVRGGDTWGRIYTQYGVCSWFIINHPPNTGRFGREGSLIAGNRLRIPVRYSGKPEFNPYYYGEFSAENVGVRCENAGKELREAFEELIRE